jgi:hypothetical protein
MRTRGGTEKPLLGVSRSRVVCSLLASKQQLYWQLLQSALDMPGRIGVLVSRASFLKSTTLCFLSLISMMSKMSVSSVVPFVFH